MLWFKSMETKVTFFLFEYEVKIEFFFRSEIQSDWFIGQLSIESKCLKVHSTSKARIRHVVKINAFYIIHYSLFESVYPIFEFPKLCIDLFFRSNRIKASIRYSHNLFSDEHFFDKREIETQNCDALGK